MLTVLLKILFKCGLFVGGQNDTFAHPQTFLGGNCPPLQLRHCSGMPIITVCCYLKTKIYERIILLLRLLFI